MPRTTLALTSFVSGELGAKLDGRTDFNKYATGAKTLENFLVHPQGAATRRVGTQFIAEVKNSAAKTRLIPFEFSTIQTYVLEFGNQYMRVYKDKGQVQSGGSAFEISTPYLTAELFDIKFAQSADVMYITHPNHAARKLARTGHTSWTLTEIDFTEQGGLMWRDQAVGKLVAGDDILRPRVLAFVDNEAGTDVINKVERRLQHFIDRKIALLFEPLMDLQKDSELTGLARGFGFQLFENLGILRRQQVLAEVKALDQDARGLLRKHGVRFGQFTVFMPVLLSSTV